MPLLGCSPRLALVGKEPPPGRYIWREGLAWLPMKACPRFSGCRSGGEASRQARGGAGLSCSIDRPRPRARAKERWGGGEPHLHSLTFARPLSLGMKEPSAPDKPRTRPRRVQSGRQPLAGESTPGVVTVRVLGLAFPLLRFRGGAIEGSGEWSLELACLVPN